MNNRYLYRAKRCDTGEWVEGYLIHARKDCYMCENPYECMTEHSSLNGQYYGFGGFKLVDESTICQCTGLKDKNGRLIWENDIVKHFYNKDEPERYDIGVVQWDDVHLRFKRTSKTDEKCVGISFYSIYEVIGSAFDNLELLEVQS